MTSSHVQFNPLIVLASEDFLLGDLDVAGSLFTCYTIIQPPAFLSLRCILFMLKAEIQRKRQMEGA